MNKPNLFDYATSELSQDAFICYTLAFYEKNYIKSIKEYEFSKLFLEYILEKLDLKIYVENLEIRKQYKNMDVLLILNKEYYIIIEDKINSNEMEKQISGYRKKLEEDVEIKKENIFAIYFKTGDESYTNLKLKEKKVNDIKISTFIIREEILELFKKYEGNNSIFKDYQKHFQKVQDEISDYKSLIYAEQYPWRKIIGFYKALDMEFVKLKKQNKLAKNIGFNWGYTPNQRGGFMCYYFNHILENERYSFYLQIENPVNELEYKHTVLVVKVCAENLEDRNINVLYKVRDIFEDEEDFIKPKRYCKGTWMTALWIKNFIAVKNNEIDIKQTAFNIVEYMEKLILKKEELLAL